MSDNEFIMGLTTVALLAGFLLYMQWERARKRAAFRRQCQRDGEAINVAPLRPRLAALRRDYSAAAHIHARGAAAREGLVASARRRLGQLPFFRGHQPPHDSEHHAA
jgi:hypothetical protein